ncbi:hypothetical protein J4E93_010177 [Alternaria ventricosa]|uniref:uncharacterized protein n=1 Tax=Alternaria ventricosa TaxID=1187951 RepID=UPI0020C34196|nr:uncharacterized protein J4E93_010177 [Alternaria ventricosa]KAI4638377.1 hypothetical protein J4E93_010177 [Alternaria ventricosa]
MDGDTTMNDASDVEVVSRLLELPGELRNHIYSVIVAGEEDRGFKLHRKRRGRSQHSKHSLRDRHPSRQFLGLAQTNRLFRSEFWPLYAKAHRPMINIEELAEYLEVVPLSDGAINDSIITTLKAKMVARMGQPILVEQLKDVPEV